MQAVLWRVATEVDAMIKRATSEEEGCLYENWALAYLQMQARQPISAHQALVVPIACVLASDASLALVLRLLALVSSARVLLICIPCRRLAVTASTAAPKAAATRQARQSAASRCTA